MHLENSVEEMRQELVAGQRETQILMAIAMGFVRLVDATGRTHSIPMMLAGSFEVYTIFLARSLSFPHI